MSYSNFQRDLQDWISQRGTFGWTIKVGGLLGKYPQHACWIVENARIGPGQPNQDQHNDMAQALLCALSRAPNAAWTQEERDTWIQAGQQFMDALIAFGRDSPVLLAKLILHEESGYAELGEQIRFCLRHLPQDYDVEPLFHTLLPDVLQRTAEVADDPQVANPWLAWDTLLSLGQRAQVSPQKNWLEVWMEGCLNGMLRDREAAGRLLAPLLQLGVDINACDKHGQTLLEQRAKPHIYTGEASEQAIILALLDHGADWTRLSRHPIKANLEALIEHHPVVRRERLGELAQAGQAHKAGAPRIRRIL